MQLYCLLFFDVNCPTTTDRLPDSLCEHGLYTAVYVTDFPASFKHSPSNNGNTRKSTRFVLFTLASFLISQASTSQAKIGIQFTSYLFIKLKLWYIEVYASPLKLRLWKTMKIYAFKYLKKWILPINRWMRRSLLTGSYRIESNISLSPYRWLTWSFSVTKPCIHWC